MDDLKASTRITPEQLKFARILHPYAMARHDSVVSQDMRFVHYTSAEAAVRILQSKEVWMRKSSCMNDYLEVQYGLALLSRVYRDTAAGHQFQAAINRIFPGITNDVERLFNGWTPHFQADTYLACISEHSEAEDKIGRLSMWRAYGEGTGVALVMNNPAFMNPADGFAAYASPVAYLDGNTFEQEFRGIIINIEQEAEFIKSQGREATAGRVFNMFRLAVLCTKHPGFAEEKEWRIVYCPSFEKSPFLLYDVQIFRGVPQPIYKIPLRNIPEVGLQAEVPALLERIIIGPTQYPLALAEGFVHLLSEAGISDAADRIHVSDIPLRR